MARNWGTSLLMRGENWDAGPYIAEYLEGKFERKNFEDSSRKKSFDYPR